jgi:ribonuclease VapC
MMVVDASAILAILLGEPDGLDFERTLAQIGPSKISPVNLWECLVRIDALTGSKGRERAEQLLDVLDIQIEPITADHARLAADAFRRFGKRTPANLNLGDCFAYGLAMTEGDGLLYKGEDFGKTDVLKAG